MHSHGKGRHETDDLLRVLGVLATGDELRIEIRRKVLVEDLALGHGGSSARGIANQGHTN